MDLKANVDVRISPQGYQIGNPPVNQNPFWDDDTPTSSEWITGLDLEKSVSDTDDTYKLTSTNQNGAQKKIGSWTVPHGGGSSGSGSGISSLSLTNENGTYTLTSVDSDGNKTEVGTIEVPETETLISEINDDIVENDQYGYDFHTLKETQNDSSGTQNVVGQFYLSRLQNIGMGFNYTPQQGEFFSYSTVNQSGELESQVRSIFNVTHNFVKDDGWVIESVDTTKSYILLVRVLYSLRGSHYGYLDIPVFVSRGNDPDTGSPSMVGGGYGFDGPWLMCRIDVSLKDGETVGKVSGKLSGSVSGNFQIENIIVSSYTMIS